MKVNNDNSMRLIIPCDVIVVIYACSFTYCIIVHCHVHIFAPDVISLQRIASLKLSNLLHISTQFLASSKLFGKTTN